MPDGFFVLLLMGGLLALDGTSLGQTMVSRPLVAGVLTGLVMGDPATGLLVGGVLEFYSIPVFPVGGAEFPEGGPPAVVAVVGATLLPGVQGLALGVFLGLFWTRIAALSIRILRGINGQLAPDPSRDAVGEARISWGHLSAISLDFLRGAALTGVGITMAVALAAALDGFWPLGTSSTLGLLLLGASIPAGAFVASLGGWRKRGVLFFAGLSGFLIGSFFL